MLNPFAEAAANGGALVADVLTGRSDGTYAGGDLGYALPILRQAFGGFCDKHGISSGDYAALLVRFLAGHRGNRFIVTVEDRTGRRSSREYEGGSWRRSSVPDALGRRRPKLFDTPVD